MIQTMASMAKIQYVANLILMMGVGMMITLWLLTLINGETPKRLGWIIGIAIWFITFGVTTTIVRTTIGL